MEIKESLLVRDLNGVLGIKVYSCIRDFARREELICVVIFLQRKIELFALMRDPVDVK